MTEFPRRYAGNHNPFGAVGGHASFVRSRPSSAWPRSKRTLRRTPSLQGKDFALDAVSPAFGRPNELVVLQAG